LGLCDRLSGGNSNSIRIPPAQEFLSISHNHLVFGSLLLLIGAAIAVWAQWIFRKEITTTDPTQTSAKLVTWGPYKFSRNPMYLGLFLAFMGVDMILTFVWSLVLLIFVLYYVNWIVIPIEENQLQKTFGETYVQYCMKVRRWL